MEVSALDLAPARKQRQPWPMQERIPVFDYDVAVLGAGSGGYAAARTVAGHGLKTALLEGAREVGGLCILRGCMPTKALLYAAEVRHLAQRSALWGLKPAAVDFDFQKVMARKDVVIEDFAAFRRKQLSNGRFKFIRQAAKFLNPHTLETSNGERITAKSFVIATGSRVAPPPLPQLESAGYLTSDDALNLPSPPRSLIVLGGGAVALEFAQFFARFDTQVTLLQRSPQVLKGFDADASATIVEAFGKEGIRVLTGTRLLGARKSGRAKVVEFELNGQHRECEAEEILYALGRSPNTLELGLESAGVDTDQGRILTQPTQQTTAPHIYAAGDCCGPFEIVHIAIQQGETAAHNIAHPSLRRSMDYRLLTSVVFTDPQVACVGLTEQEARSRGIACVAASYPFNDHGKSIIMDAMDGFVKLLADPATGEILGGSCVGPAGGELIHEIVVAMHKHMTVHELATLPHYHPTLAEIWTYPAEELAERISPP
jgi:pyruvate/2-oxoglutarate dehydrogenase complex dihydrolipoamide dehydrogenase (E3) component